MNSTIETLDGREIPCSIKHGMIIAKWQSLPVGHAFVLINDHDPVRLQKQFAELWPGTFDWKYLLQSPNEFHIRITKLQPLPETVEAEPLNCGH
jgi:uncharacterized protein (DUF2249 family)